jgi:CheY-like chemotaxis protein
MPQSSTNSPKNPVVVLVVEDEEVIRTLAAEFMADTGFEVLEAPDAHTAVRLLQTEAERVHVLFTDVRMPGAMDGLMLAHHTRRNWPWGSPHGGWRSCRQTRSISESRMTLPPSQSTFDGLR